MKNEATTRPEWVKVGTPVTTSGYRGTITRVCEWSESVEGGQYGVMIEVRLARGTCCISYTDAIPVVR